MGGRPRQARARDRRRRPTSAKAAPRDPRASARANSTGSVAYARAERRPGDEPARAVPRCLAARTRVVAGDAGRRRPPAPPPPPSDEDATRRSAMTTRGRPRPACSREVEGDRVERPSAGRVTRARRRSRRQLPITGAGPVPQRGCSVPVWWQTGHSARSRRRAPPSRRRPGPPASDPRAGKRRPIGRARSSVDITACSATGRRPPEDADLLGADRLERGVLRLQADVVGLAEEGLDRRLLAHERDDDVAVGRGVLLAHHDESPGRMPASFIDSPLMRRTNSPSSPPTRGGTST